MISSNIDKLLEVLEILEDSTKKFRHLKVDEDTAESLPITIKNRIDALPSVFSLSLKRLIKLSKVAYAENLLSCSVVTLYEMFFHELTREKISNLYYSNYDNFEDALKLEKVTSLEAYKRNGVKELHETKSKRYCNYGHKQVKGYRIPEEAKNYLIKSYQKNPTPRRSEKYAIAKQTNLSFDTVRIWFNNRRQRSKHTREKSK